MEFDLIDLLLQYPSMLLFRFVSIPSTFSMKKSDSQIDSINFIRPWLCLQLNQKCDSVSSLVSITQNIAQCTWVLKTYQIEKKAQNSKIGPCRPKKLGPFSSPFLVRKSLSSGQKWFLRPYPTNFLGRHGPILRFTYSESSHQISQFG